MLHWTIEELPLELKYTWKISRNASDRKTNLLISVTDGVHTGKGEAAPNIRYDETPEKLITAFHEFVKNLPGSEELPSLQHLPRALSFGIDSAYMHLRAASTGVPLHSLLNLGKPAPVQTSFTIPIMETGKLRAFYDEHRLKRFPYIKLKINSEEPLEPVKYLASFCDSPLMIDGNEAFRDVDECARWMERVKKYPVEFIEQPMPSSMKEESAYLKKFAPFPLFADESVTDHADFRELKKSFDGINMKLMKAGSYQNGISLLSEARKRGMKTMTGCMVETTLGISSAIRLASLSDYLDLDSFMLVKDEPFGMVKEENGTLSITKELL